MDIYKQVRYTGRFLPTEASTGGLSTLPLTSLSLILFDHWSGLRFIITQRGFLTTLLYRASGPEESNTKLRDLILWQIFNKHVGWVWWLSNSNRSLFSTGSVYKLLSLRSAIQNWMRRGKDQTKWLKTTFITSDMLWSEHNRIHFKIFWAPQHLIW